MSHHLVDLVVLNSVHSHDYKLTNDQSLQLCLSSNPLPSGQRYWTSPPTLIDNGFQVHLQTCSITASKFPQSWPPRAPPHSLTHALQVTAVMGSKWISNSCNYGLPKYVWVHTIPASKCILECIPPLPAGVSAKSLDCGCRVDPQVHTITVWWTGGELAEPASREPIFNRQLHLSWYLKDNCEILLFCFEESRGGWDNVNGWPGMRNHTHSVALCRLCNRLWGTTPIVWIHERLPRVCYTQSWEW